MTCSCLNLNDVGPDETSVDPLCPAHGYEAEGGPAEPRQVSGVFAVPDGEFDPEEFGPQAWAARGDGDDVTHVVDALDANAPDVLDVLLPWNPPGLDGATSHAVAVFIDEDDAHEWVEGRTGQKILPIAVYVGSQV